MIKAEKITKSFGKHLVLDNINFHLESGECVALVAPNGSGKTTLLSIIAGITTPDSGAILLEQFDYQSNDYYRNIGFMQDNSVLYPYLSGYDHLSFVAMAHNLPNQVALDTAKMLDIDTFIHKKVSDYSLGMKQQLLFAMAILHQPKLLLLDEPFNGLDPANLIKIRNVIIDLNVQQGTTVILSSHDLDEVDRIAKKIFFVKDKRIIEKDLSAYEKNSFCITLESAIASRDLLSGEWLSDQQVLVSEKELHQALHQLMQHEYTIKEVERLNNGSARLFNEIYQK